MTNERADVELSNEEIKDFARKVEEWGSGLTPKERRFLGQALKETAAAGGDEVEGFMDGINYLVALSAMKAQAANEDAAKAAAATKRPPATKPV
jgi:hypothetical protein